MEQPDDLEEKEGAMKQLVLHAAMPVTGSLSACDEPLCRVAPSPELLRRIRAQRATLRGPDTVASALLSFRQPRRPGLNDGTIIPANRFPLGVSADRVRAAALERAPLRGAVRIIVVLVEFSDQRMTRTADEFRDLFFSTGSLPNGSVREYFAEVSNGLIDIQGEVVGPYLLPQTLAAYAHGESGTGTSQPNAQTMARDAATAADPDVDFTPYDNDGNGFVDAFIVIHAGRGAEETGSSNDIWSHKWILSGPELHVDSTDIYGYLTVPEDSKIGVCAHELGHLLFGWPDLYDTDSSSSGLGDWCLMAGGSWNGAGDIPAHPSAWCKAQQQWVSVTEQHAAETVQIPDVKAANKVWRLWQDGANGPEYFLLENRQRTGYDSQLPGDGLLVYHIDDSLDANSDESHYKVGLIQADNQRQLELGANQGDDGDPYPGSASNTELTGATSPNTRSYAGLDTSVSIRNISASSAVITADLAVAPGSTPSDPVLRRGSKGSDVRRLQQALVNLAFDPGTVDGDFGPRTEKAVRAYQTSRGLVGDGIVGKKTWAALHADGQ
jgi:immune inhibitor A